MKYANINHSQSTTNYYFLYHKLSTFPYCVFDYLYISEKALMMNLDEK